MHRYGDMKVMSVQKKVCENVRNQTAIIGFRQQHTKERNFCLKATQSQ